MEIVILSQAHGRISERWVYI